VEDFIHAIDYAISLLVWRIFFFAKDMSTDIFERAGTKGTGEKRTHIVLFAVQKSNIFGTNCRTGQAAFLLILHHNGTSAPGGTGLLLANPTGLAVLHRSRADFLDCLRHHSRLLRHPNRPLCALHLRPADAQ